MSLVIHKKSGENDSTGFHLSDSLVNILNHVKMLPVYVGQAAIFLFGEPCPDCLLLLRVSNLTVLGVLGDKVTYGEDVTLVELVDLRKVSNKLY